MIYIHEMVRSNKFLKDILDENCSIYEQRKIKKQYF